MSSEAEGACQAVPPPPACLPHWLGGATSEPQEEGEEEWGSSVKRTASAEMPWTQITSSLALRLAGAARGQRPRVLICEQGWG